VTILKHLMVFCLRAK